MSRTLPDVREGFVAALTRDTPGSDLPRLLKVLDALVAWSVARSEQLALRTEGSRTDTLGFELVGTKTVFWSAQVTRGAGPRLEIYPPTGRALSAEDRADVIETLNEHSRDTLVDGDRLRIGFGALKNDAARAAVLALLKRLLASSAASTQEPATASAR